MAIVNGGRILKQITPIEATKEIEGQIWSCRVERDDLDNVEEKYNVLSSSYNQDNSLNVRVYASGKPSEDFVSVVPQLDDVYFIALKQDVPVEA